jgi:hypothetical protein
MIGMRNFCFGLMISSTLSLVMAALCRVVCFVRSFVWGEKRRRRCINTHTHVENERGFRVKTNKSQLL